MIALSAFEYSSNTRSRVNLMWALTLLIDANKEKNIEIKSWCTRTQRIDGGAERRAQKKKGGRDKPEK